MPVPGIRSWRSVLLSVCLVVATVGGLTGTPSLAAPVWQSGTLQPVAYLPVIINGVAPLGPVHALRLSVVPDRSNAVDLQGRLLSGTAYIFLSTTAAAGQIRFYLDDPNLTGPARQTETDPPYDFAGGLPAAANPFDTNAVLDGPHTITAAIDLVAGGTDVVSAGFVIVNCAPAGYDQVHLAWTGDSATTLTVAWRTCTTLAPSVVRYRPVGAATWQTATGALRASGTAGTLHEVTLTGLAAGSAYEYTVAGDGGMESSAFRARTGPLPGARFDFVYVADTGLIGRTDGLASGTRQVVDEIVKMDPLLILGGGDYAYFNSDTRYGTLDRSIDAWFNEMQPAASGAARDAHLRQSRAAPGRGLPAVGRSLPYAARL